MRFRLNRKTREQRFLRVEATREARERVRFIAVPLACSMSGQVVAEVVVAIPPTTSRPLRHRASKSPPAASSETRRAAALAAIPPSPSHTLAEVVAAASQLPLRSPSSLSLPRSDPVSLQVKVASAVEIASSNSPSHSLPHAASPDIARSKADSSIDAAAKSDRDDEDWKEDEIGSERRRR